MSEWTCHNCSRIFRSRYTFSDNELVLCPECKARIDTLKAQKEYWEAMKQKLQQ
jgi:predicted nucleic acid-binding Zn ribbon protein